MGSDADPNLVLELPKRSWHLVGLSLGVVALLLSMALRDPARLGTFCVLPIVFVAIGRWIWPRRLPRPSELRVCSEALELVGAGFRERIPWAAIASVREYGFGLAVTMASGRQFLLPRPPLAKRGAFQQAIPPGVAVESLAPSSVGVWVWVLWAFLLGGLAFIWLVEIDW